MADIEKPPRKKKTIVGLDEKPPSEQKTITVLLDPKPASEQKTTTVLLDKPPSEQKTTTVLLDPKPASEQKTTLRSAALGRLCMCASLKLDFPCTGGPSGGLSSGEQFPGPSPHHSSWDFAKNKMQRDANFDWQYYLTG